MVYGALFVSGWLPCLRDAHRRGWSRLQDGGYRGAALRRDAASELAASEKQYDNVDNGDPPLMARITIGTRHRSR